MNGGSRQSGVETVLRRFLILSLPILLTFYFAGCCAMKKKDAGNPFDGPTPPPAAPCDQTPPAQPAGSGSVPVIMPNNGGEAPPGSVVPPASNGSVGLFENGGDSQRPVSVNESAPSISEAHYEKQDSAPQIESGLFLAPGESGADTGQNTDSTSPQTSPPSAQQPTSEGNPSALKSENQAAPFEKGAIPEGFNDYSNKEKSTGALQPVSNEKTPSSNAKSAGTDNSGSVGAVSGATSEKAADANTAQKPSAPIAPIEIPPASGAPELGGPVAATDQVQFRTIIEK